ncbi:hypothetical protein [Streptococcus ovuberis]|uniref:Uncharacterized protein n=1 Tax=Streptococcus ovuberis TaxID=1936207 RepID=A0A7X6S001_9STRE|nr:hypothetical protein [Streptococcus ovuberis]NKZ19698.1 hypothetical protein [Streptococcus ovuberis]
MNEEEVVLTKDEPSLEGIFGAIIVVIGKGISYILLTPVFLYTWIKSWIYVGLVSSGLWYVLGAGSLEGLGYSKYIPYVKSPIAFTIIIILTGLLTLRRTYYYIKYYR